MDARYNMNSLLLEAIQEIAIEMVVDPSFVEKDFYAVHVLSKIAEIQIPDVEIVFTGGTSLSKAYGLSISPIYLLKNFSYSRNSSENRLKPTFPIFAALIGI